MSPVSFTGADHVYVPLKIPVSVPVADHTGSVPEGMLVDQPEGGIATPLLILGEEVPLA